MKIDLVSRYFKPLKYSENVIRYVPELPLSFLLLVVFDRQQLQNFPPPFAILFAFLPRSPFRTNSKFLSTIVSLNEGQNKQRGVAVENPRIVKINFKSE